MRLLTILLTTSIAISGVVGLLHATEPLQFENLGRPLKRIAMPIETVTKDPEGRVVCWGWVSDPERFCVIGINAVTGKETVIDLAAYRRSSSIQLTRGINGDLYIYAGSPARFFRYIIGKGELVDLGAPAKPAHYILGHVKTVDGKFYVGSYPMTSFVGLDTATDKVIYSETITRDERQKYIVNPKVDCNGTIYIPVGLHHGELWALNPKTQERKEILTDELRGERGTVFLQVGEDGAVYGKKDALLFRCYADRVEVIPELPKAETNESERTMDGIVYQELDATEHLLSRDSQTGKTARLKTDAQPQSVLIYSISDIHDGKLFGGGFIPANTWTYDLKKGEFEDWGKFVTPNTQIYDTLAYQGKLFLSSYSFAHLDCLDPVSRTVKRIGSLYKKEGMERIQHLLLGSDKAIYGPTRPSKGHLDGGIVKVNPETLTYEHFSPLVKGLAPTSLAEIAETGELFVTTTNRGGTSALPIHSEAKVLLWNMKEKKVVWEGVALPGVEEYAAAVRSSNGLVYGIGDYRYFVFDPIKREMVKTGKIPIPQKGTMRLARQRSGPDGTVYALAKGVVIAIDGKTHEAKVIGRHSSIMHPFHEALHGTEAIYLSPEGVLYYGGGSELWRVNPSPTADASK